MQAKINSAHESRKFLDMFGDKAWDGVDSSLADSPAKSKLKELMEYLINRSV